MQAEKVRAGIFNFSVRLIDTHMSVEFWAPPPPPPSPPSMAEGTKPVWLSSLDRRKVRSHPLAEIVIWNGFKELRRYRQPKIQPRDSIIQGTITRMDIVDRLFAYFVNLTIFLATAWLKPETPIDSITRHDTGIVYLLLRERGDRTKLSLLANLFHAALEAALRGKSEKRQKQSKGNRDVGMIAKKEKVANAQRPKLGGIVSNQQAVKRLQQALVELQCTVRPGTETAFSGVSFLACFSMWTDAL